MKKKKKQKKDCKYFRTCSANKCPLDKDIKKRNYITGEDKCKL